MHLYPVSEFLDIPGAGVVRLRGNGDWQGLDGLVANSSYVIDDGNQITAMTVFVDACEHVYMGAGGNTDFQTHLYEDAGSPSDPNPALTRYSQCVNIWGPARADWNCDGTIDFFDYDDYVICFEDPECPFADFDCDGSVDFFDYDAFVLWFEQFPPH